MLSLRNAAPSSQVTASTGIDMPVAGWHHSTMVGRRGQAREERLEAICDAHVAELVRFVGHRVPQEAVGDVVAEVFAVAWRRLDEVDPDNPRAWLYAVAHRLVANEHRSRLRRRRLEERAERLAVVDEPPRPEDWVGAAEDRRLVPMTGIWGRAPHPRAPTAPRSQRECERAHKS